MGPVGSFDPKDGWQRPFDEPADGGAAGVREADGNVGISGLTKRQAAVLDLAVTGLYAREIAHELGISTRTVEGHLASLRKRSGTRNLQELVAWAVRSGAGPNGRGGSPGGGRRGAAATKQESPCPKKSHFPDTGQPRQAEPLNDGYDRRGRPTVMTDEAIAEARSLLRTHTIKAAAAKLGVSRSTLYKYMPLIRPEPPGV